MCASRAANAMQDAAQKAITDAAKLQRLRSDGEVVLLPTVVRTTATPSRMRSSPVLGRRQSAGSIATPSYNEVRLSSGDALLLQKPEDSKPIAAMSKVRAADQAERSTTAEEELRRPQIQCEARGLQHSSQVSIQSCSSGNRLSPRPTGGHHPPPQSSSAPCSAREPHLQPRIAHPVADQLGQQLHGLQNYSATASAESCRGLRISPRAAHLVENSRQSSRHTPRTRAALSQERIGPMLTCSTARY